MPLVIPKPGEICPALATEPFNTVVYGYPGIGKTPMCAVLPDHLYLDCQVTPGTKYVACRRIHITSYQEFEEAMAYVHAHPPTFLIIDPLTSLHDWAEQRATDWFHRVPIGSSEKMQALDSVLELKGKDENTGSPGWLYLRNHFEQLLKPAWAMANTRTIFVGHVRDALLKAPGDKGYKPTSEVDDKDLDLSKGVRNKFLSECDLAGFVYRSPVGNTLKIGFSGRKDNAYVKCRCPQFLGRTLDFHTPTTVDDWRQLFPETLAKLCGPAAAKPAAPATPATINRPNMPVSAKP